MPSGSSAAITSTSSPNRDALARYGLMVGDVQDVVATALGGETDHHHRRRARALQRQCPLSRAICAAIRNRSPATCWCALPSGGTVPLGRGGDRSTLARGPTAIRTENGQLAVYIFVDIRDRDLGGYVADAQKAVAANVQVSARLLCHLERPVRISGAGEARLRVVVPVTLLIIFLLLYLNFRRLTETLIVMLSLPFALVGGVWLMWWLGFNLSVAVAVGFIALAGVAAETGVVMLIYLDHAMRELQAKRAAEGRPFTRSRPAARRSCSARSNACARR